MFETDLDRLKAEACAALETFLDRLTLPTLSTGPTQPLELTLTASLRASSPLPPQTMEMTATPLKVRAKSTVITTGAALPVKTPRLEDYFAASDLRRIDDILES